MKTWTVHWTQEGYVEIDAESKAEALDIFKSMSSHDIRDLGDAEAMVAGFVEEAKT